MQVDSAGTKRNKGDGKINLLVTPCAELSGVVHDFRSSRFVGCVLRAKYDRCTTNKTRVFVS